MSSSHDFPDPESVMPGAVGQPGDRTFFLQVAAGGASTSFKVEKQQVAALCEYLGGILADLAPVDDTERVSSAVPSVPDSLEWVVGRLAVAYEEADDRIVVVAEEFVQIDEADAESIDLDDPASLAAAGYEPATARIRLTRAQVADFIAAGNDLVRAGRPACRLCGQPIDPEGHACPRLN